MTGLRAMQKLVGICLLGLVLAAPGALPAQQPPAAGRQTWVGCRNDTNLVIVIRGSSVVNGQVRYGPRHQLNPLEKTWDPVAPGVKTVTVWDARQANRILFQGQINVGNQDQYYSVQFDRAAMAADGIPRVKLAQVPLPPMMANQKR
jgi:hypothetical protein